MSFVIRAAWPKDLERLAVFAADAQVDPERFCAYVAESAAGVVAEVADTEGWPANAQVALDDERNVIGWLLAETDADMGRIWWWGPFVADAAAGGALVADALLSAGLRTHPEFGEHELAVDARSQFMAGLAARHGFTAQEGSVVMVRGQEALREQEPPPGVVVSELEAGVSQAAGAVAELHDRLFPATHTPGDLLVSSADERLRRWVASRDGRVLGYIATELQLDGSLYIDYLGVEPSERNVGLGRRLVGHALGRQALHHDAAGSDRRPARAHLTVRVHNAAARALYASIGFTEERIVVPYRLGFSLS